MTTLMSKVIRGIKGILHLDRIEAQQEEIQRRAAEARRTTDRALAGLDKLARSDDPLARFVHGAKNATFRRRIREEKP